MEAGQSAIWMFGAVLTGSLMMFNPALLPDIAENIFSSVSQGILVGTSQNTTANSGMCAVPQPAGNATNVDKTTAIVRSFQCVIYQTFVFIPWEVGAGTDGIAAPIVKGQEATVNLGGGATATGMSIYQLDAQSMDVQSLSNQAAALDKKKIEMWHIMDTVATGPSPAMKTTWTGGDAMERTTVAASSLVAAIAGLGIIGMLSIYLLVFALGMSILTFFSPFFCLVAVVGHSGKRISLQWMNLYVGTVLKRLITIIFLSMAVAIYGTLLRNGASSGWGVTTLAVIVVSAAMMMYRKQITNLVGEVNFGQAGTGQWASHEGISKGRNIATGALLGGLAAIPGAGLASKAALARPGTKMSNMSRAMSAGAKATAHGVRSGVGRTMLSGTSGLAPFLAAQGGAKSSMKHAGEEKARTAEEHKKNIDTPTEYSAKVRANQSRDQKYRRDWEQFHNDKKWLETFTSQYGQAPPNPGTHTFTGYGLAKDKLTKNDLPRPRGSAPSPVTTAAAAVLDSKPVDKPVVEQPVSLPKPLSRPTRGE
jgi:hypothetical protein